MSDQNPQPAADVNEIANGSGITPAEPAGQPATAKPQNIASGVSILTVMAVSVIASAFAGLLSWHFATQTAASQAPSPIVLLDASKIVEIESKAALSTPGLTEASAAAAGKQFVAKLNSVLDGYAQSGVIVLNSNVVLSHPASQSDITEQVAQKLGLKLN
jgi:hypothetical protein